MHADHSFIQSVSQSFSHSVIHLFIHSFVHSFVGSFVRSFIHSFIHSFIRSFIDSLIHASISLAPCLPPSIHAHITLHYITLHHIHIQNISKWGDAVRWKMVERTSAHIRPDHERTSHSSRPCWQRFPKFRQVCEIRLFSLPPNHSKSIFAIDSIDDWCFLIVVPLEVSWAHPLGWAFQIPAASLAVGMGKPTVDMWCAKRGIPEIQWFIIIFPVKRAVSGHSPLSDNPVWLVLHITYIQVCIYLSKYTPATVC